jgi:hypothetical protein
VRTVPAWGAGDSVAANVWEVAALIVDASPIGRVVELLMPHPAYEGVQAAACHQSVNRESVCARVCVCTYVCAYNINDIVLSQHDDRGGWPPCTRQ